ncbi:MAG: hypothetical protein OSB57_04180 [Planctomycetota bacterium]|nr:hypothetical protein [Planctomycetota bacterium]
MTDWTNVFSDFAVATEDTYLKDPKGFLNEASTRTTLLSMGLKGSANKGIKTLQGGENVKEQLFAEYEDTVVDWSPTSDTFELPNPQFLQEHGIPWRFTAVPITWSDVEVELQPDTTRDGQYRRLTDLYARKRQHAYGNLMEQMDVRMLNAPNYANQEASAALQPYSLPSAITEANSGGYPLAYGTAEWGNTRYQGFDTSTNAWWKNQTGLYSNIDGHPVGSGTDGSLFEAFDDMMLKTEFKQYPMHAEATASEFGPSVNILCSRWGKRSFMSALRNSNEMLVTTSRQDPAYNTPMYSGIPVQHIERLGTNELYKAAGSALTTEDAADKAGPRFTFWNSEYLCPIFHSSRYFKMKKPGTYAGQPFRNAIWIDTWWQMFCRSKRRQGIVSPGYDISSANGVAF